MRQNNASTTENHEENTLLNLSRMMTSNYKNYTEPPSIEKISEQKNTGLPSKTAEPASDYMLKELKANIPPNYYETLMILKRIRNMYLHLGEQITKKQVQKCFRCI